MSIRAMVQTRLCSNVRTAFFAIFMQMLALSIIPCAYAATAEKLPDLHINPDMADLGRQLFFEQRLSGTGAVSCATCHNPKEGWSRSTRLGSVAAASPQFRNVAGLINVVYKDYYSFPWYLDGRLRGSLAAVIEQELTLGYIMNIDLRLLAERLRQDEEYTKMFRLVFDAAPDAGRVVEALAEFIKTVVDRDSPYDRGELSTVAERGRELFYGKAGCVECHSGLLFTDGKRHGTGVPENDDVFTDVQRHAVYLAFLSRHGVANRYRLRVDVGGYLVTHRKEDVGTFITPSLRGLKRSAPYMHNGMFATLDQVIGFYNKGTALLRPLELSGPEKTALKIFLLSLSGDSRIVEPPTKK